MKNMRTNISVTNFKYRSSYEHSLSPRVCSLLQTFFESNGWYSLYEKVNSFQRVQIYVEILMNISYSACKCFCKIYFEAAAIGIRKLLTSLGANDLRSLSLSQIDNLMNTLSTNIMPRIRDSPVKVAEYKETFFLEFSLFLFNCDVLPRRIDGLQRFLDLADSTNRYSMKSSKFLKAENILICIREERLLFELLKVGQHLEVLKRAADILKWIASQGNLQLEDVDMLWEAGNTNGRDVDATTLVYKIICDLSSQYNEEHYNHFSKVFSEETIEYINAQKLNAMAELGNEGARKSQEASSKIGQILLGLSFS